MSVEKELTAIVRNVLAAELEAMRKEFVVSVARDLAAITDKCTTRVDQIAAAAGTQVEALATNVSKIAAKSIAELVKTSEAAKAASARLATAKAEAEAAGAQAQKAQAAWFKMTELEQDRLRREVAFRDKERASQTALKVERAEMEEDFDAKAAWIAAQMAEYFPTVQPEQDQDAKK